MSNVVHIQQTTETKIADASAAWLDAKAAEEIANKRRLEAEERLCALIDHRAEGATKIEQGPYRITITGKISRTLDASKLADMDKKIPAMILQRLVEYAPKLNLKELRYVEANEPETYRVFAEALTVKPAKTAVSVEIK